MTILLAHLILTLGFFIGGILLLSVHVLARIQPDVQNEEYGRYHTVYHLIYGILLIIAAIVILLAHVK